MDMGETYKICNEMKDIILSAGFKHHSSCSCSGTYAEKYVKRTSKGLYKIEIKPTRKLFIMRLDGVVQCKGTEEVLTAKMQEYGLI